MLAFTICSNNYLSRARVLGESLARYNEPVDFRVILVDRLHPNVDYRRVGFPVTPIESLRIPEFASMCERYSLVELNTAVKPFAFRHLFQDQPDATIAYFDPDIEVYGRLSIIDQSLADASVLLTPHVVSPIPRDNLWPAERAFLQYGLYNLGFCAMRHTPKSAALLDWWAERLVEDCRIAEKEGVFVDQLWMNFAPLFFGPVSVSRNVGLNVAYWNLHERRLSRRDGAWMVNDTTPLLFYHFSSFNPEDYSRIGRRTNTRTSAANCPEMVPLLEEYRQRLEQCHVPGASGLPCHFASIHEAKRRRERRRLTPYNLLRRVTSRVKRTLPAGMREFIAKA